MNIEHFKRRLLEKERELLLEIARLEGEGRGSGEAEAGDVADAATSSEDKSTSFQESTLEWQTLTQVRDALRRIQDGTYGKCVDCGRPIDDARLEAIPWTPYCREDQEKRDRGPRVQAGSPL